MHFEFLQEIISSKLHLIPCMNIYIFQTQQCVGYLLLTTLCDRRSNIKMTLNKQQLAGSV